VIGQHVADSYSNVVPFSYAKVRVAEVRRALVNSIRIPVVGLLYSSSEGLADKLPDSPNCRQKRKPPV
jgi:hypothetical protein